MRALKTRLLLSAAAFIAVALLLAAVGLTVLFERHVKSWIDAELDGHLDQLIAGIDRDPTGALSVASKPSDPRFEQAHSGLYWQIAIEGEEAMRSRSLWDFAIALPPEQAIDDQSRHHSVAGPDGQRLYLIQRTVELPARLGAKKAHTAVGLDEAQVKAAVWRFAQALVPYLACLGALLMLAAWLQVTVGLRPLASIKSRIATIRSGSELRLGAGFATEVQPLALEIDTLLDARDRQLATARTRAQDLAHGLKTPLQVLSGGIARLRAKGEAAVADDLENAAHMMQRHVDRQLARARMQSEGGHAMASVEEAARRVVRVLERTPSGSRLSWDIEIPAALSARIHTDDLAEALGGLAENAARFARARVRLTASAGDGVVVIDVTDDGPGIPAESLSAAVERGTRLDTSGSGTGLGLAIVSDIAEAWGGDLKLSNDAGLFSARLRLPYAGTRS